MQACSAAARLVRGSFCRAGQNAHTFSFAIGEIGEAELEIGLAAIIGAGKGVFNLEASVSEWWREQLLRGGIFGFL